MSLIFKYPIKLVNNCQVIAGRNDDKKHSKWKCTTQQ